MENPETEITEKEHMTTLVSCINSIQKQGYTSQFQAKSAGLLSLKTERVFQPGEVSIVHFFRFEGESDPSDSAILYAIETTNGEKGTLVDGYGKESDPNVSTFISRVEGMNK